MTDDRRCPGAGAQLAAQVGAPAPMRRGSLSERYVKCSKPGCACADGTEARHGPYYSLTRRGRPHAVPVPVRRAGPRVRRQIEAGRQFRQQVDAYWEACERWADAELEARPARPRRRPKKGAPRGVPGESRRGARPRS